MMSSANTHRGFADRKRELSRASRKRKTPRYRSIVLHWLGGWLRAPRALKAEPLPEVVPGQVSITFVGHTSILIRYTEISILVDPVLGDWLGAKKRTIGQGLPTEQLSHPDCILATHLNEGHLHLPTLKRLSARATVVVPAGGAARLSPLRFARLVELRPGHSVNHKGVDIAATPVSSLDGLGFVIRGNGPTVFVCGRSSYFPGFAQTGTLHAPDIAILPIGGYCPGGFRERHMTPLDALYAFEDLGSRILVPTHHSGFPVSYERTEDPLRWLAQLVDQRSLERHVVALPPGASRVFTNPRRVRRPTPYAVV